MFIFDVQARACGAAKLTCSCRMHSKRVCETWRWRVREGHAVEGGVGTGQKAVAEGEQIERGW